MAKIKTALELTIEAENLMKDARKKQQQLLKIAKEIEMKNSALLGEEVVKFFKNESTLDKVKALAIALDFISEDDKSSVKESKDFKSLGENDEQL